MKEIKYPFDDITFNEDMKVYVDANIFINYSFDNGDMYDKCKKTLKKLKNNNVKIFVSNIVISEVANKIIYKLFADDLYYKIDDIENINTEKAIDKMVSFINKCKYFNIDLESENLLDNLNFSSAFNYLNKDRYNRYLLKPYCDETIKMINQYREFLNFSYLDVTTDIYYKSLNTFQCQMIGINDAQHLQVSLENNIDYILTIDKDFNFVAQSFKTAILKI